MLLLLSLCVAATAGFLRKDSVVSTKGTTLKHVIQTHAVLQGFADAPTQPSLTQQAILANTPEQPHKEPIPTESSTDVARFESPHHSHILTLCMFVY